MSRQQESKITGKCLKYLDKLKESGVFIYYEHRSGQGGFSYKKGIPDLFIVINSVHIECEFKTESGKLSTMQEKYKLMFERLKIPYICPHSFEEFEEEIKKWI